MRICIPTAALVLALVVGLFAPGKLGAQFAVAGKKVAPTESNFAGVRQVTPRYGLVVQINHDVRASGDLDLALVDEVYGALLSQ